MGAEDFRLEHVDARGDLHEGPLEVMWPARFEAAGQVRTFPSYRGRRNFPGWYWAATCAELAGDESWVELGRLMRLDCDPGVVAMASQPFRLPWRRSGDRARRISRTPDCFVRLRDGTGVVLDVRPDDRIEPEDAVKFEVTATACARVGNSA
ncbi:TnsA-like heteromeric transposase endonuclease subunit, partial [Streptomyces bikiniensis]|uniref:TnsA-like heteromeric transposase endonuclease subunit n=1 Tax=Streptomyces bikiniensis TaxID=1896 RepID=UPI0004BF18C2